MRPGKKAKREHLGSGDRSTPRPLARRSPQAGARAQAWTAGTHHRHALELAFAVLVPLRQLVLLARAPEIVVVVVHGGLARALAQLQPLWLLEPVAQVGQARRLRERLGPQRRRARAVFPRRGARRERDGLGAHFWCGARAGDPGTRVVYESERGWGRWVAEMKQRERRRWSGEGVAVQKTRAVRPRGPCTPPPRRDRAQHKGRGNKARDRKVVLLLQPLPRHSS